MVTHSATERLGLVRDMAEKLGFCACGVTTADPLDEKYLKRHQSWLNSGAAGGMSYLARDIEKRFHPREIFPQTKSVIVLAMSFAPQNFSESSVETITSGCHAHASWACTPQNYDKHAHPSCGHGTQLTAQSQNYCNKISQINPDEGYISVYARGRDYHKVLKQRAEKLCNEMRQQLGDFEFKICVDTAPVAERSLAVRAGLGFIGKNCLLIVPGCGSMVVLCEIFCSLDISPTHAGNNNQKTCGPCRKCVDACPTAALRGDGELDASRCISCLTIENSGEISDELAAKMGNKIFGCDDCMLACPHNASIAAGDTELRNDNYVAPKIDDILSWSEVDWDSFTRGHASRRAKFAQFIRNAKIAEKNEIKN